MTWWVILRIPLFLTKNVNEWKLHSLVILLIIYNVSIRAVLVAVEQYEVSTFCAKKCFFSKVQNWRWLFHQRPVGKKIWFSPPPEASIGRMIKPLGMRRVQTSSSKPPMLDYTCDEHVVNTRWLKAKKKGQKTLIFWVKTNVFDNFFTFSQRVLITCSPYV